MSHKKNNDWAEQLAQWQTWLDEHYDDPTVIAACTRLARRLGGDRG